LTVCREMSAQNATKGEIFLCPARLLPLTLPVQQMLGQTEHNTENYVLTDSQVPVDSTVSAGYMLKRLHAGANLKPIQPEALQMTFIKRAIQSGLSAETVEAITGMDAKIIKRRFTDYAIPDTQAVHFISEKFRYANLKENPRSMNLLILGAGSHGHAVKETAELLGVFQKISFLDDHATGADVVGKCSDYQHFLAEYPAAFVAIGDNTLRCDFTEKLKAAGYIIPRLIHPDTTISKDVKIGDGTIICAQATINTGAVIGESCIIATNSMVGFDANIGSYSHIDCGAMIMKGAVVNEMSTIESGTIIK